MSAILTKVSQPITLLKPGLMDYREAWELQQGLLKARQEGRIKDTLILLEHPPTYTLGRRGKEEHVLLPPQELARRGITLYWVDRGGDVTYHGPGQLVGYPIVDLRERGKDVHGYIRGLERVLIRALAPLGISAQRDEAYTGVWVGDEKIAAIGVKISRGVTMHGFALNVNTDLSYFEHIIPCGIEGRGVTSIARVAGRPVEMGQVMDLVLESFVQEFPGGIREITLSACAMETGYVG